MVLQYKKKPVVIEALQIQENIAEIIDFCPKALYCYTLSGIPYVLINTLEGRMQGELGDWIIKGVEGEFYPCKPNIFEKTYELVNN